jgi:lysophospholipase L1-like esterase
MFVEYEPFNGFEYDISRFEEMDLLDPPSDSAVMFLGSSSVRLWSTLEEDFPEIEVLSRGFGGSKTTDMLHYFDRLFGMARPAAIVYFCGNNDLVRGVSPDSVVTNIGLFLDRVSEELPGTHVYVLSLKASISQIRSLEDVKRTNRILEDRLKRYTNATYVDVIHTMLDGDGQPVEAIFSPDNNHMNREGYHRWTEVLKPVILKHSPG